MHRHSVVMPFMLRSTTAFIAALLALFVEISFAEPPPRIGVRPTSLFDGKTLAGWEGNSNLWRVEDGALTGGSFTETVKQNEFLATTRDFSNFIVRMQIKLTGTNGFINSGFQIRSQRVPRNSEMSGYQCDFGDPNWWGAIYDESRRNKVLSPSDMAALGPVIKRQDWNEYVIRADGPRITTWINGVQGTDYVETDPAIPDWGKLGIQVHGGGKAVVQVKEITIEELPPTPAGKIFRGAPEPKKNAKASPLSPEDERASFTLPAGFEIELVASESEGVGKFVTVDWDQRGNLWTMTALEYPVDANESPAVAKELYASRAKDKVLVFERDAKSPTGYSSAPRVFADGLAIPLGILPYKNGVYVQHGPDIVFLSDADGDGRADKRDVILSGFGVQDSHLFPHQFTRAPGNWIWFAQGAFNYGKVRTTRGAEKQFDQTRMAKFRHDGSDFEITSQGPCNIWGLVLNAEGECFIQEANDYGYPVMPFHEYANYPGCSGGQWKSYAPEFPGTAPDFQMGGTGLSGLALSDAARSEISNARSRITGWPEAYADVMYVANPITRKIQAIKIHREGPRYKLQKLPDFVLSSDEMFRPVSIHFGPDGCLYIVDWYNKIISHNEVPRNHPERDKKRGRIWRVKHSAQKPLTVPDFTKLSGAELITKLGGDSLAQHHLAWQAIVDRQLIELTPALKRLVGDAAQSPAKRVGALWALSGLKQTDAALLRSLFTDTNRNVRREAVRACGQAELPPEEMFYQSPVSHDSDPEVRAEVIRVAGKYLANGLGTQAVHWQGAIRILANVMDATPIDTPLGRSTHNGKIIRIGAAYEREFERYLIRMFLEQQPKLVAEFLKFDSQGRPLENTLLATLALEPKASAPLLAKLLPELKRPPNQEEVLRLAQFPEEPGVGDALKATFQNIVTRNAVLDTLVKAQTRLDRARLSPLLTDAARELWQNSRDKAAAEQKENIALALRLIGAFKLTALEPELTAMFDEEARREKAPASEPMNPLKVAAMTALRDMNSSSAELFAKVYRVSAVSELRESALSTLVASKDARAPQLTIDLWPELSLLQRRTALSALAGTKAGASTVIKAVESGALSKRDLDAATLDKLHAVLGDDPKLETLLSEMALLFRPVLRLDGKDNAWLDSDITLDGAFTIETWVKLDAAIDNNDGILGAPGVLDMNFHASQFRVWAGKELHDVIIAKKKIVPEVWTHVAVTRGAAGKFRLYLNGELDTDQSKLAPQKLEHLRIGWTAPAQGTAGWLSEFRVWRRARSADEIRADFDRSFEGEPKPRDLAHYFTGSDWGKKLQPGAKVIKTSEFPPLLNGAEAKELAEKFTRFRALAEKSGHTVRGKELFASTCQGCHAVGGQGGQVGPVLNGAGASGIEALLRNVLTPSSAMEAGYRVFRVELKDGDVLDGILVSQDSKGIVLRQANVPDKRIVSSDVRRAEFINRSMMPEGLLDALRPEEVTDLFAYLKTLK
jgi:putative membrane-bound dehydrogenase-like protein